MYRYFGNYIQLIVASISVFDDPRAITCDKKRYGQTKKRYLGRPVNKVWSPTMCNKIFFSDF